MLNLFTWISIFYFAFACDPQMEALQWRPENSILLRSLGWNRPSYFYFGEPFMGHYVGYERYDGGLLPYSGNTGLERFYLNNDGTLSLDSNKQLDGFLLNGDDILLFDDYVGLESLHLIGGDIVPSKNDTEVKTPESIKKKLWPAGVVPYVIASNYSSNKIEAIKNAMKYIENVTCIHFVPRTKEANYIRLYEGTGCNSEVGMSGGGQNVSLGPNCNKLGVIMHELLHVLGFEHEQSRSDRDKYINILWDNIRKGHEKNFKKTKPEEELLLTPYDYDSIMQYGEYAFSKNMSIGLKTMTPKKKGVILRNPGDKVLSPSDIKRISILYNC